MKVGSIVEYIGGQCEVGKKQCELFLNTPYIVSELGIGVFTDGEKAAIRLEEHSKWVLLKTMFREIQTPNEVNLNVLLNEEIIY